MDNWCTSVPLVEKLLWNYKITAIGTLRKNKTALSDEFSNPTKRPIHTSIFGFTEDIIIVFYILKQRKNVILISSMHHYDDIDINRGDKSKPVIVTTYNNTQEGVDVVDKLYASYNCFRKSRRGPMVIFYIHT
ncbi:uncharacterized protein [Diabrotica undecimpunctata]|uniref:uncharacterized protein n=1 Tax=Diabrotica undecimpunctata TaxID=50387 RepID=UPI003B63C590